MQLYRFLVYDETENKCRTNSWAIMRKFSGTHSWTVKWKYFHTWETFTNTSMLYMQNRRHWYVGFKHRITLEDLKEPPQGKCLDWRKWKWNSYLKFHTKLFPQKKHNNNQNIGFNRANWYCHYENQIINVGQKRVSRINTH